MESTYNQKTFHVFSEDSSSSSDTESVATTSRSSDLRTCPLRSLLTNYGDDGGSFSPINTDFPEHNDTTGPVDPVFVDEESSGEAVASAADHDDFNLVPPLPGKIAIFLKFLVSHFMEKKKVTVFFLTFEYKELTFFLKNSFMINHLCQRKTNLNQRELS